MKNCICTVVTPSHLHRALALHESVRRHSDLDTYALVVTQGPSSIALANPEGDGGFHALSPEEVFQAADLEDLRVRFEGQVDRLCWAAKSALMLYLLEREGAGSVLYLDSDIHLCDDFSFLFELLAEESVILTPHWRPISPDRDPVQFHCGFRDGLYNAGFIGASAAGADAIRWWHEMCRYRCEKNAELGLYDDQRYLDVLPLYFPRVQVVRHRGCNVAEWNRNQLERSTVNGHVVIDGRWPLVFAHFTQITMESIDAGQDPHLEGVLAEYRCSLERARRIVASSLISGCGSSRASAHPKTAATPLAPL